MPKQTWWFDRKDDTLIVGRNDDEPIEVKLEPQRVRDIETASPLERQRMLKAQYELNT